MSSQYYQCGEGHIVRVDLRTTNAPCVDEKDIDPEGDIVTNVHCVEHDLWMQPVPVPDGEEAEER